MTDATSDWKLALGAIALWGIGVAMVKWAVEFRSFGDRLTGWNLSSRPVGDTALWSIRFSGFVVVLAGTLLMWVYWGDK